jgi:eukaryotic-like serine/threonine-protein kinase
MDPVDRTLAGRYRLEEVIGRGGMSTVYRATDLVLGRTVAVKVLLAALAEQDPTYTARFAREAQAAAALASSAVVTIYDTGVDEDGHYIVMEHMAGQSLAEVLADERPLGLPEALRIAERVAEALSAAHAAGILHRDIKPANVMVSDGGSVKVLDFGIARRLDGPTLTQVASVAGTAAYMAPERALGQAGDARADLYSLGCLLYAMLTGGPPFGGEVAAAVLHQQINARPRPPSELRAGIPPALDALVLELLAKAPNERPTTAAEVQARLLHISADPAPTAPTRGIPAAGGTAPTAVAPVRRAPGTSPLADHRRRAVVMAIVTAAIALGAVALLAGGAPSKRPRPTAAARARSVRTSTTTARSATVRTTTAKTTPKPAKPPPAPPPASGAAAPPGHGGTPPGQAKKHGGGPGSG